MQKDPPSTDFFFSSLHEILNIYINNDIGLGFSIYSATVIRLTEADKQ